MNCSVCGTEFRPSTRFCGVCGASLETGSIGYPSDGSPTDNPMVGFGLAIKLGFENYVKFGGRATRAEYWWWQLFVLLVSSVPIIGSVIWLATFIPSIAVTSRRLHDIGRTGWWQALPWGLSLVFVVSLIFGFIRLFLSESSETIFFVITVISLLTLIAVGILLLVWFCRRGQNGINKYGPDPRTTSR